MALTKVIGDGLGAIPAISGASLTSLTSSQVDSGATTAKAWVNFNGTGTVAIRDSGNVSSVTDSGTGDYRVNFTTAMADVNYAGVTGGCIDGANPRQGPAISNLSTSQVRITTGFDNGALTDWAEITVAVFR